MTEVSVVIATFNRVDLLRTCLAAFERQTVSPDRFEVVVVDDGSSDQTASWLRSYRPPYGLLVEHQENRGQAAALNRGIELARSPACLLIDDDIVADEDLVAAHIEAQAAEGVVAAGSLRLELGQGLRGGLVQHYRRWWEDHYRRLSEGLRDLDFWACYSGNLSAPTRALREVGGFDTSLPRSYDVELAYRLWRSGLALVHVPGAGGVQLYAKGFDDLTADFERAGAAAIIMLDRHPELLGYPPVGDFAGEGRATAAALRLLLVLRVPATVLRPLDRLLGRRPPARVYFLLQRYLFWRGVQQATAADRPRWQALTRPPVIIMYHAIGADGEPASRFVLPLRRFKRQLAWIRLLRHPVLSLDDVRRAAADGVPCPPRGVVITFDDGYTDTARLAAPALRARGMTATVFVVTGAIGDANRWTPDGPLAARELMDWDEVRALADDGMQIGAHTVSHPRLTDLPPTAASAEITDSRQRLEEELGRPVRHFAYPFGATSPAVRELAAAAGFDTASGIHPGAVGGAVPLADLRRHEVPGTRSLLAFALGLWLGVPPRRP